MGQLSYQYTLHWWAFDPPNPLVCVSCIQPGSYTYSNELVPSLVIPFSPKACKQRLFAGHTIGRELHLLVCEGVKEDRVTVVGRG